MGKQHGTFYASPLIYRTAHKQTSLIPYPVLGFSTINAGTRNPYPFWELRYPLGAWFQPVAEIASALKFFPWGYHA